MLFDDMPGMITEAAILTRLMNVPVPLLALMKWCARLYGPFTLISCSACQDPNLGVLFEGYRMLGTGTHKVNPPLRRRYLANESVHV